MFLAERVGDGLRVALRVLEGEKSGSGPNLAEPLREHVARVAALSTRCTAIGTLHECGRADDGGIYLAFEPPEGPTLAEVLEQEARLDPERAVRLAVRLAEALESAHMLGISHGGLTPRNIVLLGEDESVKLTEFGVSWLRARAHADVDAVADSPYLAPEQLASGEATAQGDVYAVGAILYQMLSGRPPELQASSRRRPSIQPLRKLRPDVSRSLEHVVTRALEPDPERRYRDMTDLFNDLWGQISPFSGPSPAQQDIIRRGLASGRRTRLIAVGIVGGAIVVIALLSRLLVTEPPALVSPALRPAPLPEVAAPAPPASDTVSQARSVSEPTPVPPAVIASPPAPEPPTPRQEPALRPQEPALRPQEPAPRPQEPAPRPQEPASPPPSPARRPVVAPTRPPARAAVEAPRAPARSTPPVVRPAGEREPIAPASRPVETPAPTTPARDTGDDGAAIIDWLLKESSSARR